MPYRIILANVRLVIMADTVNIYYQLVLTILAKMMALALMDPVDFYAPVNLDIRAPNVKSNKKAAHRIPVMVRIRIFMMLSFFYNKKNFILFSHYSQ